MAKMKGIIIGDASGKVGNTIAKVVAGEQIISKYQPEVANPNTDAQIDTRSRFKLMSQLAASMKREIAIPRKGLQSGRNRFVKTNFDLVSYEDGAAAINLNFVQLTNSLRSLGTMSVNRSSGTTIRCSVAVKPALYEKIVVCAYRKSDDEKLEYLGSSIADVDASGTTVLSLPYTSDAVVTYAYGIAYSSAAARAKYGNLEANPAQQVASLVESSSATAGAARFSKTIGCTMNVGQNSARTYDFDYDIVSVNNTSQGSVSMRSNGNEIQLSNSLPDDVNVTLEVLVYSDDDSGYDRMPASNIEVDGQRITFSLQASGDYLAIIRVNVEGVVKSKEYVAP